MKTICAVSMIAALATAGMGCSKDPPAGGAGSASASASATAAPTGAPSASAAATPSAAPSAASGSTAVTLECPKGSTGEGSFVKPCEAKGKDRQMEVTWNGKIDDKGPYFRVTNKAAHTVLYGKIAVYFYDKAGKQLDVQDTAATPPKAVPYRTCSGNMFSGVMKPAEKAVLTFSCVKKEHVPEGTAAIEAEMQMVGFADSTEKHVDSYWRNNDLSPDARKKGAK